MYRVIAVQGERPCESIGSGNQRFRDSYADLGLSTRERIPNLHFCPTHKKKFQAARSKTRVFGPAQGCGAVVWSAEYCSRVYCVYGVCRLRHSALARAVARWPRFPKPSVMSPKSLSPGRSNVIFRCRPLNGELMCGNRLRYAITLKTHLRFYVDFWRAPYCFWPQGPIVSSEKCPPG